MVEIAELFDKMLGYKSSILKFHTLTAYLMKVIP